MTLYPWYTKRERVMSATDIKASAYAAAAVDRACESASRRVEALTHRKFYPWTGTRYRDWPNDQSARTGRLWLDSDELISLTALESPEGTSISTDDVQLEPNGSGPPYTRLELDRSSSAAFSIDSTSQRSIVITGVFGYRNDEESAGTLASSMSSSVTTLTGAASRYGVGDLLRVGDERMIVTDRTWATTGQTATLTSSNAAQSMAVSDGTAFVTGEELLIEAERLFVLAITGNTLVVQRAWSGSTLAAHSGATIYHQRALTVTRGAVGTTAASHSSSDAVYRWLPPAPVEQLSTAYALDTFYQESAGYARTVGAGEHIRIATGRRIAQLEEEVYGGYARKARTRAV